MEMQGKNPTELPLSGALAIPGATLCHGFELGRVFEIPLLKRTSDWKAVLQWRYVPSGNQPQGQSFSKDGMELSCVMDHWCNIYLATPFVSVIWSQISFSPSLSEFHS